MGDDNIPAEPPAQLGPTQHSAPPPEKPPEKPLVPVPPEGEAIKKIHKTASHFGIIVAVCVTIYIVYALYMLYTADFDINKWGIANLGGIIYAIIAIVMGYLFYQNCGLIRMAIDHGEYVMAKKETVKWMVLGMVFLIYLPGFLLLFAYLKYDYLFKPRKDVMKPHQHQFIHMHPHHAQQGQQPPHNASQGHPAPHGHPQGQPPQQKPAYGPPGQQQGKA